MLKLGKWEATRITHPNTLNAYYDGILTGSFSRRELEIVGALETLGEATDRQIMEHLGYTDMNSCRPRITELVNDAKLLEEVGSMTDSDTNKRVRVVRIRPLNNQRQMKLF